MFNTILTMAMILATATTPTNERVETAEYIGNQTYETADGNLWNYNDYEFYTADGKMKMFINDTDTVVVGENVIITFDTMNTENITDDTIVNIEKA